MKKNGASLYSIAFDQLPDGAIILDKHGLIASINKHALKYFNRTDIELIGEKLKSILDGKKNRLFDRALLKANNSGESSTTLYINSVPFDTNIRRLNLTDSEHIYILLLRNVEKVLEAQNRLKLFYRVSRTLSEGSSTETTLYKIIKTIGRNFKWCCINVWLADNNNVLRCLSQWCTKELSDSQFVKETRDLTFELGEQFPGKILELGEPRWRADFSAKEGTKRRLVAKRSGIKSVFGFPIKYDDHVFGVIEFFSFKREFPNKDFYQFIYAVSNQIAGFVKRRQDTRKLRESELRYRTLVELAPDIIYSVNKKGNIESLNEAFDKITKLKRDSYIGSSITEIIHPDDRDSVADKVRKSLKRKNMPYFSARIKTASEDTVVIGEFRNRAKTVEGKIEEPLGIIVDLTDRNNLEKQKDIWLGIATHELKTPLTSIKAFTQLLLTKESNPTTQQHLKNIDLLVGKMTDLINDLLDITRISSGTLNLETHKVDINSVITSALSIYSRSNSSHEIRFEPSRPCYLTIDEKKMSQVVLNLLSNAIKYSPKNTKITIRTKKNKRTLFI